ncbi:MAG: FtsX-like permease family protein [Actinopolymorphaceae bacterium]
MIGLAWTSTRAGGWPRALLIAACTAMSSGLLLVALAMALLPTEPQETLFPLVADPGLRAGTALSTVMLAVPLVLLLYQGVRLGTASRERRFAALRVAGATPNDVRNLGAVEVGIPVGVGALLGIVVYRLLLALLGGDDRGGAGVWGADPRMGDVDAGLVPSMVAPTWWQYLLVAGVVTSVGLLVGWRVSGRVAGPPVGVARGQRTRPPRPWGLLALALAGVSVGAVMTSAKTGAGSTALVIAAVWLAVLGTISLSSWVSFRVGRYAETRARSAAMLLAARRLVTEPRPAGRAGAAIGGIALVAGGAGQIAASVIGGPGQEDPFYTKSLLLVAGALVVGLLATTGTIAIHSVESLLDRRRAIAALVAAGTPVATIERAQRYEAVLVSLPMAAGGVLLGSLALGLIGEELLVELLAVPLTAALTLVLVAAAVLTATGAVRPWLVQATRPDNLRTE